MLKLGTSSAAAFGGLVLSLILSGAVTRSFQRNQKAFYADPNLAAFVRPGLTIKITSAAIAQDGLITVVFSLTDPQGLPLDRTGVFNSRSNLAQLYRRAYPFRPDPICRTT